MINVCMVARDRFNLTTKTLGSLYDNTLSPFSLMIVDDASKVVFSKSLGDHMAGTYKSSRMAGWDLIRNDESRGVGGAKNQCVRASEEKFGRGEWLYLTDNDVEFRENWFSIMEAAYLIRGDENKFRLIGGYAHPFNGTNHVFGEATPNKIHEKNAVDGLSWLMRWETWDKYGPLMDNARGVRQSEDWEWCQRVRKDGYRVGVVYPHVIRNMGLIDTFGEPIPGVDEVRKQQGMDVEKAATITTKT